MAYVNVYDNGGGIRKVAVLDNVRNIIGTTTDGGQTGANLAAELAAISVPVNLVQSGIPFVRFAGNASTNGVLFSGTAGQFTLSAGITSGAISCGYGYLPANAPGLSNAAGWYYFTMSDAVTGIFYNNQYVVDSESPPTVPASLTSFPNGAGGRLAQAGAEITCIKKTIAGGAPGTDGLFVSKIKTIATAAGGIKTVRLRAGVTELAKVSFTSTGVGDFEMWSQMAGRIDRQINSGQSAPVGTMSSSAVSDMSSVDFTLPTVLSITIECSAVSESLLIIPRSLTLSPRI